MPRIQFASLLRELLILVLGILIAFLLNNWAQSRSERALEQRYLQNLHDDLVADSLELATRLVDYQARRVIANRVIGMIYNPNAPGRDSAAIFIFRDLQHEGPFVANQSTYNTLIYSGDFKLLRNFELRKRLAEHYHQYGELEGENERSDHFIRSAVTPYMMNETTMANARNGNAVDLSDPRLQNIVFASLGIMNYEAAALRRALDRCREVLIQLNRAI